jgi:hypothetical protein
MPSRSMMNTARRLTPRSAFHTPNGRATAPWCGNRPAAERPDRRAAWPTPDVHAHCRHDAQHLSVRRREARLVTLEGGDFGLSATGNVKVIEGEDDELLL